MAPFYESERRLQIGEVIKIGPGPKKTTVEPLNDDHALVTPLYDRPVYVGRAKPRGGNVLPDLQHFRNYPEERQGKVVLCRESVSTHRRRPQIVWRKK